MNSMQNNKPSFLLISAERMIPRQTANKSNQADSHKEAVDKGNRAPLKLAII